MCDTTHALLLRSIGAVPYTKGAEMKEDLVLQDYDCEVKTFDSNDAVEYMLRISVRIDPGNCSREAEIIGKPVSVEFVTGTIDFGGKKVFIDTMSGLCQNAECETYTCLEFGQWIWDHGVYRSARRALLEEVLNQFRESLVRDHA